MNKVLITGATGFIGGHLINELLERNYMVKALGGPASKRFIYPKTFNKSPAT